ncbi:unnamed protein product [Polarella glacialis]|uniref:Uncharacterized protein n=1 Tax=Polarella glacialis TaxID=89957 RepID=A0A813HAA5_POLGL|nr:unnamed protein product [Polarella glacialis]
MLLWNYSLCELSIHGLGLANEATMLLARNREPALVLTASLFALPEDEVRVTLTSLAGEERFQHQFERGLSLAAFMQHVQDSPGLSHRRLRVILPDGREVMPVPDATLTTLMP